MEGYKSYVSAKISKAFANITTFSKGSREEWVAFRKKIMSLVCTSYADEKVRVLFGTLFDQSEEPDLTDIEDRYELAGLAADLALTVDFIFDGEAKEIVEAAIDEARSANPSRKSLRGMLWVDQCS